MQTASRERLQPQVAVPGPAAPGEVSREPVNPRPAEPKDSWPGEIQADWEFHASPCM